LLWTGLDRLAQIAELFATVQNLSSLAPLERRRSWTAGPPDRRISASHRGTGLVTV